MDLQIHNFAASTADVFQCYKSDKQCKEFIDLIAKDLSEDFIHQNLSNDDFFLFLPMAAP